MTDSPAAAKARAAHAKPGAAGRPLAVIVVAELLGTSHGRYGDLTFGNVATHALADIAAEPRFRAVAAAIAGGVRACAVRCAYFPVCLGGAPANKLGELDDFAGTETMHCRLTQQALLDAVLDDLERYGAPPGSAPITPTSGDRLWS